MSERKDNSRQRDPYSGTKVSSNSSDWVVLFNAWLQGSWSAKGRAMQQVLIARLTCSQDSQCEDQSDQRRGLRRARYCEDRREQTYIDQLLEDAYRER